MSSMTSVRAVVDNDRLATEIAQQWIAGSEAYEAEGASGFFGGFNRTINPFAMAWTAASGHEFLTGREVDSFERTTAFWGAAVGIASIPDAGAGLAGLASGATRLGARSVSVGGALARGLASEVRAAARSGGGLAVPAARAVGRAVVNELAYQTEVFAFRYRRTFGADPYGRQFFVDPGEPVRSVGAAENAGQIVLHQDQVIMNAYQSFYNKAWQRTVQRFNQGRITVSPGKSWRTVLGQETDIVARRSLNASSESKESRRAQEPMSWSIAGSAIRQAQATIGSLICVCGAPGKHWTEPLATRLQTLPKFVTLSIFQVAMRC